MKNNRDKKYNRNNSIPPFARMLNRKIQHIKDLEKNYWKSLNEQKENFSKIDESFQNEIEKHFPDQSSLIYACHDGAVLVRLSDYKENGSIEVKYFDMRLEKLLEELPIPHKDRFINLTSIIRIGPRASLRSVTVKFGETEEDEIHNLYVAAFKYDDEERLADFEDALQDIQHTLIAINSGLTDKENQQEGIKIENIIDRLKNLLNEYTILLNIADKEEQLQVFIKEHPILLQPYAKVFPKQKLGEDFITDFILTNTLDQGIKYTFVELEKVSMPVFTKQEEFSKEFNHACTQTLNWDVWLENNKAYLQNKLPGLETPDFLIVAGRSIDFSETTKSLLRAWNRRQKNLTFLTYDDLIQKLKELIENLEIENNIT